MEHNYEVKTSNRVLTVARSDGRISEDFLSAGWVCFLIHIWSQSEERVDPGWGWCKIAWCSKHYTPVLLPWLLWQSPSLASLFSQLTGCDKFSLTGTHQVSSLHPQKKGFWMLRLHHSVFFIMFSYSSTTCCVFTFFSKQHKSRLKG